MAYLEKTSFTLEKCKNHLDELKRLPPPGIASDEQGLVESYLVQYMLVTFYAEIESELADIVRSRLSFEGDQKLATFVFNLNEKMIKRAKTGEIRNFLKNFGCTTDDILMDVTERDLSYYGSAIANRHTVSHADGVSVSLSDFEKALCAAKKILVSVKSCIQ